MYSMPESSGVRVKLVEFVEVIIAAEAFDIRNPKGGRGGLYRSKYTKFQN